MSLMRNWDSSQTKAEPVRNGDKEEVSSLPGCEEGTRPWSPVRAYHQLVEMIVRTLWAI